MTTTKRRRGARGPVDEDKILGARVRARRIALGLSQKDLAEALGVTFQQVQKYESGSNRISAFSMFRLSTLLGMAIERVFDGLDPAVEPRGGAAVAAETAAPYVPKPTTEDAGFVKDAEAAVSLLRMMNENQRRAGVDALERLARD
ncbi:MAG: helix-turn-helix transcriptional regulator [Pseudomonadota bacterium]